ncbi:threonine synthase [Liquorilactobacillus aquaticus DSM 21051]|uniref:Threonine synthase n=1 Tax=Liquorilactobacillus aquaticus DSM 21051 TaxID=1423725 RepID=A0A0R2D897_9LACO|nr:threonine synthase [Liquorilactobacillus aquaticus]KRM96905.1 threonine synthase [Liquorilactobacillus aquaticus DSM 21051]
MNVLYRSTRDKNGQTVTASQAILQGLSPDGGLYVPVSIPKFELPLSDLEKLSYRELAYHILQAFYSDFSEQELKNCINKAYGPNFTSPKVAPITSHAGNTYLELFHGPTIAFKDIALQLLPHLMTTAARKNNLQDDIVILTATSGDTGKAAMAGFADVPGTKIIVFYPKDGVSPVQEKQMLTQKGENTFVVGVEGNFDDAQTNVKKIFNDPELNKVLNQNGFRFSSANSINIGRLFPQVVYYFYAYGQLLSTGKIKNGEAINFSVPTGNFGNILAGYFAQKMGLPINKLICASNRNNVLTDFFNEGVYDKNRPFYVTSSPSMDILVSSNLERLLFYISGEDSIKTKFLMDELTSKGIYKIDDSMRAKLADFYAAYATEEQTGQEIARVFAEDQVAIDPHTAVASYVAESYKKNTADPHETVVVSTASPYKFPQFVLTALHANYSSDSPFTMIDALHTKTDTPLPQTIKELATLPLRHPREVKPALMKTTVTEILGIDK